MKKQNKTIWKKIGNTYQAYTPVGVVVIYKEAGNYYSITGTLINANGIEKVQYAKDSVESVLKQKLKDLTEYVARI